MSPRCCPPPRPLDRTPTAEEEVARVAKAPAHPARVPILRYLREREECVMGAVADEVTLAQSTGSQHVRVLRDAGLVHGEVDGPRICYRADATQRLREPLDALIPPAGPVRGPAIPKLSAE